MKDYEEEPLPYSDAFNKMKQNYYLDDSGHIGFEGTRNNSAFGIESLASNVNHPKIIEVTKLGYDLDRVEKFDEGKKDELKEDMILRMKRKAIVQKRAQNKNLMVPSGRKEVLPITSRLNIVDCDLIKLAL